MFLVEVFMDIHERGPSEIPPKLAETESQHKKSKADKAIDSAGLRSKITSFLKTDQRKQFAATRKDADLAVKNASEQEKNKISNFVKQLKNLIKNFEGNISDFNSRDLDSSLSSLNYDKTSLDMQSRWTIYRRPGGSLEYLISSILTAIMKEKIQNANSPEDTQKIFEFIGNLINLQKETGSKLINETFLFEAIDGFLRKNDYPSIQIIRGLLNTKEFGHIPDKTAAIYVLNSQYNLCHSSEYLRKSVELNEDREGLNRTSEEMARIAEEVTQLSIDIATKYPPTAPITVKHLLEINQLDRAEEVAKLVVGEGHTKTYIYEEILIKYLQMGNLAKAIEYLDRITMPPDFHPNNIEEILAPLEEHLRAVGDEARLRKINILLRRS